MSDTPDQVSDSPAGGASHAAKEFREGQAAAASANGAAAKGLDSAGIPPAETPTPPRTSQRLFERKMVRGKAVIALGSGFSVGGTLVDLSQGGVCALLDDPVTIKKVCVITCNISQNGISHKFSLPSVVAYCVLVSGRGYKVGFQFGTLSPAAAQVIADVLKAA